MKEVTPLSSILTTPLSLRRCWRLLEQQHLLGWTSINHFSSRWVYLWP